jgi:hypothetical protein
VTARLPSFASARARVCSPGAMSAHPRLKPAAPATTMAESSRMPWGSMRP